MVAHPPEYYRRWRRESPNYPLDAMLANARARAKKLGLPFDLRRADVPIPETCPVLGIPIWHGRGTGQSGNSPSIDRIVPALGYVKENVVVVSFRANRIKNDATLAELEAVTEFYRNPHGTLHPAKAD